MWRDTSTWAAEALAVFAKEWRCEFRTRYALNTLGLFAFTTLVVVSVSLGPLGVSVSQGTAVLPVLLWVILLFSAAAGLPRAFVQEEETQTATALRLAATPSALFCGKLLYGLTLTLALEALVTPVYVAMTSLDVKSPGLLAAVLAAGRVRARRRQHAGGGDHRPGAEQGDAVLGPRLPRPPAAAADRRRAHAPCRRRRSRRCGPAPAHSV